MFLGGLQGNETEDQAREVFGEFGEIVDVTILEGFGFIEFADAKSAADAKA